MSDQPSKSGYSPEDSQRLHDRTDLLLRMLRGDPPHMALDALLSVYATVAAGFGRAREGAHMLRLLAGVLETSATPHDMQQALNQIPQAVRNVPPPTRPDAPLPPGYSEEDVARVEALSRAILDLVEGDKGHNAFSALISCYVQIADHLGETASASQVLLKTGAGMLARGISGPTAAGAPVPTTSAKLH